MSEESDEEGPVFLSSKIFIYIFKRDWPLQFSTKVTHKNIKPIQRTGTVLYSVADPDTISDITMHPNPN
jgi:hypothetical protein